jgi:DNA processing protein
VPHRRDHEIAAIVALMRSGTLAIDTLAAIADAVGSAVEVLRQLDARQLPRFLEVQPRLGGGAADGVASALSDVETWIAQGVDVRSFFDSSYPSALHTIFNRPPLVFVEGTWQEARDYGSIAVVGTRRASEPGLRRARKLTRELVEAGFTIVSGLALGIDAAAHRAALGSGGRTVAVLGSGLRRVYPPANRVLARRILAAGGGILSQFFPDQPPTRWTFPKRNVVMSGLTLATVVVEAGETSGAKMQARIALEHGRSVFLLRSLVAEHGWARKLVEEGAYGARAIEAASTSEILDRLAHILPRTPPVAV